MNDVRLGRIRKEDPRDRNYLLARKVPIPSVYGWRIWPVPHLYDQGPTPQCVGFSTAAVLSALESPDTLVFDAAALYGWANSHDGIDGAHDGTTVRAGLSGAVKVGDQIVASDAAVRSGDFGDMPGGIVRAANYLWADTTAFEADCDRIVHWLLTTGPVVIGIDWHEESYTPTPRGFVNIGGPVAGGHAIMVRGVYSTNPAHVVFVVRNSWGPWGITVHDDMSWDLKAKGGDAFMTKANLVALLSAGGEAGALVGPL